MTATLRQNATECPHCHYSGCPRCDGQGHYRPKRFVLPARRREERPELVRFDASFGYRYTFGKQTLWTCRNSDYAWHYTAIGSLPGHKISRQAAASLLRQWQGKPASLPKPQMAADEFFYSITDGIPASTVQRLGVFLLRYLERKNGGIDEALRAELSDAAATL